MHATTPSSTNSAPLRSLPPWLEPPKPKAGATELIHRSAGKADSPKFGYRVVSEIRSLVLGSLAPRSLHNGPVGISHPLGATALSLPPTTP
jgi:hypothetical protein